MPMLKLLAAAGLAGAMLLAATPAAEARTCVTKAGLGTGSALDSAKFQAWEAVLQATDWGSWSVWMGSSHKIGHAPGYAVSNLKERCGKGGSLGMECRIQATLCK
jgi:hypothetical protein